MKLKYRPEIDGLRAIAVTAVILYHAQITIQDIDYFKGGFIGVDIFFVISGYLITSIILKELISNSSFSFLNFYEKRIRRILPALLFVILISIPFAWIYLLPYSLIDFSKSILYSLGFSSNFYFHYSGQQYGAESGLLKPLLHTWSLSVEEQFYILFPIILVILFKHFNKYLLHILILIFTLSLIGADWGSKNNPGANFYFLPTRIWEILAGSILAYFEIKKGYKSKNQSFNFFLPKLGFFLIGLSVLLFDDLIFHPSYYTLIPVVGVCLIIWYSNKNELITKILSNKLFVWLGLISYSLYLWHYPIFAFARINQFIGNSFFNQIMIAFVTLILSVCSYYFIEKVFRDKKNKFKNILIILLWLIIIVSGFAILAIYNKGQINKGNIFIHKKINSPLYKDECKFSTDKSNFLNDNSFKKELSYCKKKYGKFILILGDSHSVDLYNSISKISKNNKFVIGLNRGGCRPSNKKNKCHYENSLKFIKKHNHHIMHIFFNQKGSYFLTNSGTIKDYSNSKFRKLPLDNEEIISTINYLNSIKKINNKLTFVGPHIEPNIDLDINSLNKYFKKKINFKDNSNYDLIVVDNELKNISTQNEINYLSKIEILDFKFEKDFIVDGNFTFSDHDHWSEYGELYFGRKLFTNPAIKTILSQ